MVLCVMLLDPWQAQVDGLSADLAQLEEQPQGGGHRRRTDGARQLAEAGGVMGGQGIHQGGRLAQIRRIQGGSK